MIIEINHRVPVKYYDIWVTLQANVYQFGDSIEVEDIEWDGREFTELENMAIEHESETKYVHQKFLQAFADEQS